MRDGPPRSGDVAVIFTARRNDHDPEGYDAASGEMARRAASMPGYCGIVSTRGPDGLGITVSYWRDEAAAAAWRDDPAHARIRESGRERWYDGFEVVVADVAYAYRWAR